MFKKIVKNSVLGLVLVMCGSLIAMEPEPKKTPTALALHMLANVALQDAPHSHDRISVSLDIDDEIIMVHKQKIPKRKKRRYKIGIMKCNYCSYKCFEQHSMANHLRKQYQLKGNWAGHYTTK